jgi:hypothetical protein
MTSEPTTRVMNSLYGQGDLWSMFEIRVHARTWEVDPYAVSAEVEQLLAAEHLFTVERDSRVLIAGWPLQEKSDASEHGSAPSDPQQ